MKYAKNFYISCLILIVLSVLAIFSYRLLPKRTMQILPSSSFSTFAFGDARIGGNSTANFVNGDPSLWRCSLKRAENSPHKPFCRLGVSFSRGTDDWTAGIDISKYDSIRLQYTYRGPADFVRVHFRSYDARFSEPEDYNSAKFIKLLIRDPAGYNDLTYSLSEFVLADWWMRQFSMTRDQAKISFDRVTSMGIGFGDPIPYGDHEIEVHSVALIGTLIAEKVWYLGILIFWLVTIAVTVSLRLRELNLVSRTQLQYIDAMNNYARDLRTQSLRSHKQARRDPLTGVLNRLGAQEIVKGAFKSRKQDSSIALMILDIDHFKQVNDMWGHDAGDSVLRQFSELLSANTRPNDTVARWGGEEFVLICPHTAGQSAKLIAEKLRLKTQQKTFTDECGEGGITVSIGLTMIGEAESFNTALKRADRALYQAKETGRNRWVFTECSQKRVAEMA